MAVAALALGITAYRRSRLDYNEQGRHFDAASAVVIDEQSIAVYAVLALVSGVAAAMLWGRR